MSDVVTNPGEGGAISNGSAGAGGAGTPPPAAADWTSGLNEDLKGFVALKQFKDPSMLLDSYRNLEKLTGVPPERMIKLPEKSDDPAWKDIYGRLGRPAKAEEYKLTLPEGSDPAFANAAKAQFHELGMSASQAEKLTAWWNGQAAAMGTKAAETQKAQFAEQDAALTKEWGGAYEQNIGLASRAAKEFGFDGPTIDKLEAAMGYGGVMKFMHNLGSKIGEASFVSGEGGSSNGAMTPAAAKARISELGRDLGFGQRLMAGDADTKAEWDRLNKFAAS